MKYTGVKCSACEKIFDESADAVVCPVCGAPHHRECWIKTGRCAYNNLHAEGYAWIFPENVKKAREEEDSKREQRDTKPEIKLKNGENIISCPVCGSANYENDIYCLRCGAKLSGEADDGIDYDENGEFSGSPFGAGERSDGYYRNLRSDFDRYGGISPNALVDGIPCSEYSDYVGGSRPGKIIRKISTLERYDRKISWTWAALFLGPIWFLWRKMKKEGAVISMILIFLAAMNGHAEGGGVPMNPDARMDDGKLSVCVVSGVPKWLTFLMFPFLCLGKHKKFKSFVLRDFETMEIESDAPSVSHTDGELFGNIRSARYSVWKNAVSMLV